VPCAYCLKICMKEIDPSIFRAYDIRGIYPDTLNEDLVYRIAQSYLKIIKPAGQDIVLGGDVRESSPQLKKAAADGLLDSGYNVIDIGTVSTDMFYFAVANYGYAGGLSITASHNPREYNGIKMVREKAQSVSGDSGIMEIRDDILAVSQKIESVKKGQVTKKDIINDYSQLCLSFIDPFKIKKFKIVMNPNFGLAGQVVQEMLTGLPIEIVPLNFEPDGSFPKGRPDPLIPENREETIELVKSSQADFGVAWDADADRVFFLDESGGFIDGYFMTAILAKIMLAKQPGAKIISDPRLTWAVRDTVEAEGGRVLVNKVGHSFIKERMVKEDAFFGGENSAHYYFKFENGAYYDNGMIPFLLILEKLSVDNLKLSELAQPFRKKYFISGEINRAVKDKEKVLRQAEEKYSDGQTEKIDGLSVEYANPAGRASGASWRFNLRTSNTEPLIRLNVEATSQSLMESKRDEILKIIK